MSVWGGVAIAGVHDISIAPFRPYPGSELFRMHTKEPCRECPVGASIVRVIARPLKHAEEAMKAALARTTSAPASATRQPSSVKSVLRPEPGSPTTSIRAGPPLPHRLRSNVRSSTASCGIGNGASAIAASAELRERPSATPRGEACACRASVRVMASHRVPWRSAWA